MLIGCPSRARIKALWTVVLLVGHPHKATMPGRGPFYLFNGLLELDRLIFDDYHSSPSNRGSFFCPHRLVAQDTWFSARKPGFDSPWGYCRTVA